MSTVRRISPRHALTAEEFDFIKKYLAFGKKNGPEAYRRAFLVVGADGHWYARGPKDEPAGDPLTAGEIGKKAAALLAKDYIADFLDELDRPTGDHARDVLAEEVMFGDDRSRIKAVERVLDDEDKLGFRDAVDQWAERMCAIGTEVVIPLPGGGEVSFPLREMFPRFAEALPPRETLEKTMKSLDQYLWMENGRAQGEERDPHNWRFLDGYNEWLTLKS
jgi:hypothetical protein